MREDLDKARVVPAIPHRVHLVVNSHSDDAVDIAQLVTSGLESAGIIVTRESDASEFSPVDPSTVHRMRDLSSDDLVLVIGGDGTILRAAEVSRGTGAALLGVNLGHVGFLAESEQEDVHAVIDAICRGNWTVESRLALDITVSLDGTISGHTWALNEVSVEKHAREKMISVLVDVDDRPLSRWGCDGVICSTPTGSTAYAFSAGGPIMWPEVSALLVIPISAHALFARPSVIAPTSEVGFQLAAQSSGVMWADGRRMMDLPPGSRVDVKAHRDPVLFARLVPAPFTDRLVAKFELPVDGWRNGK